MKDEPLKLLVTGGAGFIGSAVVRQAIARGHAIVNLDALTYAACLENVASVADSPSYVFERADIRRWFIEAGFDAVTVEGLDEECCTASHEGEQASIGIFFAAGRKP